MSGRAVTARHRPGCRSYRRLARHDCHGGRARGRRAFEGGQCRYGTNGVAWKKSHAIISFACAEGDPAQVGTDLSGDGSTPSHSSLGGWPVAAEHSVLPAQATIRHSWMRPPRRSVLRSRARSASPIRAGGVSGVYGARWLRGRWAGGPVRVVMLDVLGKDCFEVPAPEDQHPVEALRPGGSHDPLTDGVRSGCPDRALDDPGALCGEDGVEGSRELGVAIADEELDRVCVVSEVHRDIAGLLGDPAGDRVGRDAGDPYATAVVVDEHEHVEPAEKDGVDVASRTPSALSPGWQGTPPTSVPTCAVTDRCRGASGSPRRSRER